MADVNAGLCSCIHSRQQGLFFFFLKPSDWFQVYMVIFEMELDRKIGP